MFNENTTRHRGVWHIIEGELQVEEVPERIHEYVHEIRKNHSRACSGREYYQGWEASPRYVFEGCDCSLNTNEYSVDTGGRWLSRHITPAHPVVKAQPILCHQTSVSGKGIIGVYGKYSAKVNDGDVIVTRDRLVPLHTFQGEMPPGPTCSRCLAKAERDGAE